MIEVESVDVARQYFKAFQLLFFDGSEAFFEPEKADPILEALARYQAHRSDTQQNFRIRTQTVLGENIQFECDDVMGYDWGELGSPEWRSLYPQKVRMFKRQPAGEPEITYYIVSEDDILCLIR